MIKQGLIAIVLLTQAGSNNQSSLTKLTEENLTGQYVLMDFEGKGKLVRNFKYEDKRHRVEYEIESVNVLGKGYYINYKKPVYKQ